MSREKKRVVWIKLKPISKIYLPRAGKIRTIRRVRVLVRVLKCQSGEIYKTKKINRMMLIISTIIKTSFWMLRKNKLKAQWVLKLQSDNSAALKRIGNSKIDIVLLRVKKIVTEVWTFNKFEMFQEQKPEFLWKVTLQPTQKRTKILRCKILYRVKLLKIYNNLEIYTINQQWYKNNPESLI